jgi:hypothetical protein
MAFFRSQQGPLLKLFKRYSNLLAAIPEPDLAVLSLRSPGEVEALRFQSRLMKREQLMRWAADYEVFPNIVSRAQMEKGAITMPPPTSLIWGKDCLPETLAARERPSVMQGTFINVVGMLWAVFEDVVWAEHQDKIGFPEFLECLVLLAERSFSHGCGVESGETCCGG